MEVFFSGVTGNSMYPFNQVGCVAVVSSCFLTNAVPELKFCFSSISIKAEHPGTFHFENDLCNIEMEFF